LVKQLVLKIVVDFRSRVLAFRGAGGEPPLRHAPVGVSPVPLIPQESRTLHSNQLVKEVSSKYSEVISFIKIKESWHAVFSQTSQPAFAFFNIFFVSLLLYPVLSSEYQPVHPTLKLLEAKKVKKGQICHT
jgi:hypothetical protein